MTHIDEICDVWGIYHVHMFYIYIVYMWRTSLENGAQKFGLCAIGTQPQNPRIIPDALTLKLHLINIVGNTTDLLDI